MCSINAKNLLRTNDFSSDELPNDNPSLICNFVDHNEFNNLYSSTCVYK